MDAEHFNFASLVHMQNASPNREILDWCMKAGLIGRAPLCEMCGLLMKLTEDDNCVDGYFWMCRVSGQIAHQNKLSVREGSWFSGSQLSIPKILQLAYVWLHSTTRDSVQAFVRMDDDVITEWFRLCRVVCLFNCERESEMLGGPGMTVEISKSKFGHGKYHRGRTVDACCVVGGVERGSSKCFLRIVCDQSAQVPLGIIKEFILPGTTIISDCWKSYDSFTDERYIELTDNDSINFVDPRSDQFHLHLAEYMWRKKIKNQNFKKIFGFFLEAIKKTYSD